jgi:Cu+-exporting ATPase
MTKDPVCGMVFEEGRAASLVSHRGRAYLFCSLACRDRFLQEPARFATPPPPEAEAGLGRRPRRVESRAR